MKFRIAIPFFLISLLSGYILMGYARHSIYEGAIQEYTQEWIAFKEEGILKPMGWEDHEYLGSPEAALVVADPVFQKEIYSLWDEWLDYATEYNTDVLLSLLDKIDDNKWSLWDAYKCLTLFRYLEYTFLAAGNLGLRIAPHNDLDRGGALAESVALWEAAGGTREGDWFNVYKQSPEYETWMNNIFDEISDPKCISTEHLNPETMEDLYLVTKQQVELPFSRCLLQKDMAETQQRMTELAYERYTVHVKESNIARSDIDAWIVKFGSSDFHDTIAGDYGFPHVLDIDGFPRKDLVFDTCIIVVFSILSTGLIVRKVLPRFKPVKAE